MRPEDQVTDRTRHAPNTGDSQREKFERAAREAGADLDTSAADALMGRLAKTPPEPKAEKASRAKPSPSK